MEHIELVEVKETELEALILISYESDTELFDKYHVGEKSFLEAVESTLGMIKETAKQYVLKYFKVLFENKPIGYIVLNDNFLYSFAIAVKYRTKDILKAWWKSVNELVGKDLACVLLSNNERAIEYMKKRGMKVVWENPQKKEFNEVLLTY